MVQSAARAEQERKTMSIDEPAGTLGESSGMPNLRPST